MYWHLKITGMNLSESGSTGMAAVADTVMGHVIDFVLITTNFGVREGAFSTVSTVMLVWSIFVFAMIWLAIWGVLGVLLMVIGVPKVGRFIFWTRARFECIFSS